MYPPPPSDILNQFRQSALDSVCFGLYNFNLSFSNGNWINVSAPFRFGRDSDIMQSIICDFPLKETKILMAIGSSIKYVECDFDGSLDIIFDSEDRLIIYANDPAYEAYTIFVGGREYVV